MNLLEKSILEAPVVKKGDYNYIVHPLTDGIPEINPALLEEVTEKMIKFLPKDIDRIVTVEAMGIPLASVISIKTGIPFTIVRKRKYGLPGEVSVEQTTGYSKSILFINGLKRGEKVVVIDDVISTGGTLRSILHTLKNMGINVKKVIVAIDKGNVAKEIEREMKVEIVSIAEIEVHENKVEIKSIR